MVLTIIGSFFLVQVRSQELSIRGLKHRDTTKEEGMNYDKNVPYSTRASQVWVETASGWKLMHSHWSPKAESAGIPAAE
mgnify:CR=1 FL=1